MEESVKVNPLATEKVERLILKFSIPAIISMLVSSLYNIVDQIFIGQGVGLLGNAATNIAFPITIICTATALLLGIGSASNFNLSSGAGEQECACRYAGTGLVMLMLCGVTIAVIVLLFLDPLLHVFGVTKDVLPYAQDYTGITAFGIPFLILTTGGNHLIRADRSPTYSMTCMLTGAIINTILDPLFIFGFHWGIKGAAWATVIGQIASGCLVIVYFVRFKKMGLTVEMLKPRGMYIKGILTLGMASCINQIAMAIVQIVLNNTLRYYGSLSVYGSDIPLACVGVIAKVNMVFMAICIGLAQGCQPIWGFNYGAGNYVRVRHTYKLIHADSACGRRYLFCVLSSISKTYRQYFRKWKQRIFPVCREVFPHLYVYDVCKWNPPGLLAVFHCNRKSCKGSSCVSDETDIISFATHYYIPDIYRN